MLNFPWFKNVAEFCKTRCGQNNLWRNKLDCWLFVALCAATESWPHLPSIFCPSIIYFCDFGGFTVAQSYSQSYSTSTLTPQGHLTMTILLLFSTNVLDDSKIVFCFGWCLSQYLSGIRRIQVLDPNKLLSLGSRGVCRAFLLVWTADPWSPIVDFVLIYLSRLLLQITLDAGILANEGCLRPIG